MSARYRERLPQVSGDGLFIADGGLETTLIFHRGIDLPCFAAFDLLRREGGKDAIREYFAPYLELAGDREVGFVLDTVTWRANLDWGAQLGYSAETLDAANRDAVALAEEIRAAHEDRASPIVINGAIGPRGDAYNPAELMSAGEAERYHAAQIRTLSDTAADMVSGITLAYSAEGVGIARAAAAAEMPVAISFTVETDGRLPSGEPLADAIEHVDAETGAAPVYYMINCAHPTHFADALHEGEAWVERIGGIRANASSKSHAELDEAEELDEGNPEELGAQHRNLRSSLGHVVVLGGCCGTDHRHVAAVCGAWLD